MKKEDLEKVLGRKEFTTLSLYKNDELKEKKILITGANGSIGTALIARFIESGISYLSTDIEGEHEYLDITNFDNVKAVISAYKPDIIINIAGAKHAPEGEHETWKTLSINTLGTKNILDCCGDAKVILTSTCKACNPETVYGSSKLIAERMVLNAGGTIARFFNVVETQGNVFEIWNNESGALKVTAVCKRYFISVNESVGLLMAVASMESGRYIVNSTNLRNVTEIADVLYPDREKIVVAPRRGDRVEEKFLSTHESIGEYLLNETIIKLKNHHDKQ